MTLSLAAGRPSRFYARKTFSPCRRPFVPFPVHYGAPPGEHFRMRRSSHAYSRVTASGMLRWAEGMPCGTRVQQLQFRHAGRTCGYDCPPSLRTSPLCHHALVPFGFPRQVRCCPKGIVLNLSCLRQVSYQRRNGAHRPSPYRRADGNGFRFAGTNRFGTDRLYGCVRKSTRHSGWMNEESPGASFGECQEI